MVSDPVYFPVYIDIGFVLSVELFMSPQSKNKDKKLKGLIGLLNLHPFTVTNESYGSDEDIFPCHMFVPRTV